MNRVSRAVQMTSRLHTFVTIFAVGLLLPAGHCQEATELDLVGGTGTDSAFLAADQEILKIQFADSGSPFVQQLDAAASPSGAEFNDPVSNSDANIAGGIGVSDPAIAEANDDYFPDTTARDEEQSLPIANDEGLLGNVAIENFPATDASSLFAGATIEPLLINDESLDILTNENVQVDTSSNLLQEMFEAGGEEAPPSPALADPDFGVNIPSVAEVDQLAVIQSNGLSHDDVDAIDFPVNDQGDINPPAVISVADIVHTNTNNNLEEVMKQLVVDLDEVQQDVADLDGEDESLDYQEQDMLYDFKEMELLRESAMGVLKSAQENVEIDVPDVEPSADGQRLPEHTDGSPSLNELFDEMEELLITGDQDLTPSIKNGPINQPETVIAEGEIRAFSFGQSSTSNDENLENPGDKTADNGQEPLGPDFYYYPPPPPPAAAYQPEPSYQPLPYHQFPIEYPELNCTVREVEFEAEICTPTFEQVCEDVALPVKSIEERLQCHSVKKTVCTETEETLSNPICTYTYESENQEGVIKDVEISFSQPCQKHTVPICSPGYGSVCKEVERSTCTNLPSYSPSERTISLSSPKPVKSCQDKPITVPRVDCAEVDSEICVTVPEVKDGVKTEQVCRIVPGAPNCKLEILSLPQEVCQQIIYGYAKH